jgi:hypothetical protein
MIEYRDTEKGEKNQLGYTLTKQDQRRGGNLCLAEMKNTEMHDEHKSTDHKTW